MTPNGMRGAGHSGYETVGRTTGTKSKLGRLEARGQATRLRALAAINRVRREESRTLSAAARAEGTTVRTIRHVVPAALIKGRSGSRIRVKAADSYSAKVEIVTSSGPTVVNARGSRQRELAGRHRAMWFRVLRGVEHPSALEQFRGKKVGGQELISDFDRLSVLANGRALDALESLYVSPETHG
jgi:hypothetical protein